jgi:Polyketide cyclase / dehydrase and lipid transport
MADVEHQVRINRTPDEVWEVMGDFGGLATWFPGIDQCEMTSDDVRTITMAGGIAIAERLLERDEESRTLAYTIDDSPMPLDHHRAEWAVVADGDGAIVIVRAEVSPDAAMDLMGPVYEQAAQGLRDHLEK